MKKLVLSLAIITQACTAIARFNPDKEPFLTKSLSSESINNVDVQTSGGSISVTVVNAADARIEVYITGNNGGIGLSKAEIQKRLDEKYDLDITVTGNKVVAIAKAKSKIKDWKKSLNISFKVFVPKNASTQLLTSGGSIYLNGISGNQDFTTSGGSLQVNNVSGKIKGRTSGGSVQLSNSSGYIDLGTSGGSISAKDCQGKLTLTTSGGSLQLKNLSGDISSSTSGGSITGSVIGGTLATATSGGSIHLTYLFCSLDAATSGGKIDVAVKELGKYIRLANSSGHIQLQLPVGKGLDLDLSANKIKTDRLENFNGTVEDEKIKGSVNGGGVPVNVKTNSGRISLTFN